MSFLERSKREQHKMNNWGPNRRGTIGVQEEEQFEHEIKIDYIIARTIIL
jgi:hypothetical protein